MRRARELGSYPRIKPDARAVIPAGSHLRIRGNIKSPTTTIDVAAGATLAFELPAGAQDEPMVQVLTSVAQQNPFNLEVLPKVSVEAPRTWKVLSYGSNFTSFDAKKWSVTGPDEFRRPRVSHDKGVAGLLALSGWLRSGETPLPRLEAVRLLR